MKTINDGGPIAPNMTHTVPVEGHDGAYRSILMHADGGLSKREWFAGMALQGFLVNNGTDTHEGAIIEWSLSTADAMLAALAEKGVDQ